MNARIVLAFVALMNENPKLKHDKKAFKKAIDKAADDTFNKRKKQLWQKIKEDKNQLVECFDVYEKFIDENGYDLLKSEGNTEEMIDKLVEAFNIDLKKADEEVNTNDNGTESEA